MMPRALLRDANRPDVAWWRTFHDQWVSRPSRPAGAIPAAASVTARVRSIDNASAFIRQQATAATFWRTAQPAAPIAKDALEVREEVSRMLRAWSFGEKHVETSKECDELRDRAPLRKFSGILTYPTLAKYVGLIVDVLVDRGEVECLLESVAGGIRRYGVLAADFGDKRAAAKPETVYWSAVVLGPSVSGAEDYFGPCDTDEARRKGPDHGDFFRDGILNLNVQYQGGARFVVSALDETQTTLGFERAATDIVTADRAGQLPADQSTRLPPLHPAGIKLTDLSIAPDTKTPNRDGLVSYARHLMAAFRFDVALTKRGSMAWQDRARWRTLVGRTIQFHDLPQSYLAAVEPVRHRDDGRAQHATGSGRFETENGNVIDRTTVNQDLLLWRGEGVGAPSFHQERQIYDNAPISPEVCVDGRFDLGVDLTFDLPQVVKTGGAKNSRKCAPPLRERRSYIVGARACFVNGCGVDFERASERYGAFTSPVVLGKSAGEPFCFQRLAEIQAPDVLLPWNDRLVTTRNPAIEIPGETIDTLVIRSGALVTESAQRLLMPSRVSFDASEQACGFDDEQQPHTGRALVRQVRFRSCGPDGTFPIARDGQPFDPND